MKATPCDPRVNSDKSRPYYLGEKSHAQRFPYRYGDQSPPHTEEFPFLLRPAFPQQVVLEWLLYAGLRGLPATGPGAAPRERPSDEETRAAKGNSSLVDKCDRRQSGAHGLCTSGPAWDCTGLRLPRRRESQRVRVEGTECSLRRPRPQQPMSLMSRGPQPPRLHHAPVELGVKPAKAHVPEPLSSRAGLLPRLLKR